MQKEDFLQEKQRIADYTVVDLEMTGLDPKADKVIEIGGVRVREGKITETFSCFVWQDREIPDTVRELTGISQKMLEGAPGEDQAIPALLDFLGQDILVGHNVSFDYSFLKQWAVNHKVPLDCKACDSLKLARALLPQEESKRLENLCTYFGVERVRAHRALDDARETALIFERLQDYLQESSLSPQEREKLLKPKILQVHLKKQTPATSHQLQRLEEMRRQYDIKEELPKDLTRSQASRLYDRYQSIYGRNRT